MAARTSSASPSQSYQPDRSAVAAMRFTSSRTRSTGQTQSPCVSASSASRSAYSSRATPSSHRSGSSSRAEPLLTRMAPRAPVAPISWASSSALSAHSIAASGWSARYSDSAVRLKTSTCSSEGPSRSATASASRAARRWASMCPISQRRRASTRRARARSASWPAVAASSRQRSARPAASTGTTGQVPRVAAALAAGVLGPDHDPAVPERMLALLDMLPSRQDHDRLVDALRLLGSRVGALVLTGSPTPLPERSREAVELLLQQWWRSRLRTRRQLAGVLTSAALASEYSFPGAALARTGYPGPLGPAPSEPRRLEPLEIDTDQELSCDVVVVGSGAGGGVVAAELAAAGADVIVLEKGGYAAEADFHHQEAESTRDLYLYGLTIATSDLGVRIVAGSTLGGGTVVNYTTSFKTPPHVLADWAKVSGSDVFVSGEVEASLDAVAERLGVTTGESLPGKRDQLMESGLRKLGWHVDVLPRDVRGCAQDAACGWCGFGCRLGAKQSTMRTYF